MLEVNPAKINAIINSSTNETQTLVAIEECSELIQALTKLQRGEVHNTFNLKEEICDVLICIWQLQLIYGIDDEELKWFIERKVDRTLERLRDSKDES